MTTLRLPTLSRCTTAIAAVLLASIPFYAFLTVWASTVAGHYTLLRLYPEVLLTGAMACASVQLVRNPSLRQHLLNSVIFRVALAYLALVLALGLVASVKHEVTTKALFYGVLVDVRFLAWFFVAWVIASSSPWLGRYWRPVVLWPLAAVAVFAVLQFFALPANFLHHFGYQKGSTIESFQTINQNSSTIRAQSFLRGPNPLGAYLVLGLTLLAGLVRSKHRARRYGTLAVVGVVALVVTFSRSAWIGLAVAVAALIGMRLQSRRARLIGTVVGLLCVLVAGAGFLVLRHSRGVQDAVLHVSSNSTAVQTSNAGHLTAFRSGVQDLVRQPFGRGPGTAGPASVYNGAHGSRNSESYFLQLGQEFGWAGLLLFVAINVFLAGELWRRRQQPLALGLLCALVGLTIVNQLSYAWTDPTLAYLWWGLAGIALAVPPLPLEKPVALPSRKR